jgi:two-component system phosphate regulon response regulator PhoB
MVDILVVEDDESILELIVNTLASAGHSSTTACDGIDGLERLSGRLPDAVLLDVSMPRMDGFTMLERLKADERTRHLPVLMLTAQSAPEDIRRGVRLGAVDYIGKPFEPRQLLRRVDRLLRPQA